MRCRQEEALRSYIEGVSTYSADLPYIFRPIKDQRAMSLQALRKECDRIGFQPENLPSSSNRDGLWSLHRYLRLRTMPLLDAFAPWDGCETRIPDWESIEAHPEDERIERK